MKARKIALIAVYCVVIVAVLAIGYAVVVGMHQGFQLSCRPNCAGVDLSGISLYRPYPSADPEMGMLSIDLREVDFREANLSRADLRGVSARVCDFGGANLSNANLRDTDFAWANLAGADLSNAYMFKANLYDANLTGANLRGTDLAQTYVIEADLTGTDLTGANLIGARYSDATKWPEGFDPDQAGAVLLQTVVEAP
jgi:uncharacterized protein YjbI with pentapeptide repeats